MVVRLSEANLGRLPEGVGRPAYDRRRLTAGIVHFGVGNFHRAHQAVYLDRLMNEGAAHDWAITGVGTRAPDRAVHDATQVIAYFNYINRVADALGVERETFIRPWGAV